MSWIGSEVLVMYRWRGYRHSGPDAATFWQGSPHETKDMQEHKHANHVAACVKLKRKEEANKAKRAFVPEPVTYAEFKRRDELLREIGFASYAEYLKSDLWFKIRRRAMNQTNGMCVKCGRKAIFVHHVEYTRELLLGRGSLKSLWAICRSCHKFVHSTEARGCKTWTPEKRQDGEAQGPR